MIREDEPPSRFIQKIHDEKVEALQSLYWEKSDTSLFQNPELKMLNDMLKCSPEDWELLLVNSIRERHRLQKMISYLRGGKGSAAGKKTTVPMS